MADVPVLSMSDIPGYARQGSYSPTVLNMMIEGGRALAKRVEDNAQKQEAKFLGPKVGEIYAQGYEKLSHGDLSGFTDVQNASMMSLSNPLLAKHADDAVRVGAHVADTYIRQKALDQQWPSARAVRGATGATGTASGVDKVALRQYEQADREWTIRDAQLKSRGEPNNIPRPRPPIGYGDMSEPPLPEGGQGDSSSDEGGNALLPAPEETQGLAQNTSVTANLGAVPKASPEPQGGNLEQLAPTVQMNGSKQAPMKITYHQTTNDNGKVLSSSIGKSMEPWSNIEIEKELGEKIKSKSDLENERIKLWKENAGHSSEINAPIKQAMAQALQSGNQVNVEVDPSDKLEKPYLSVSGEKGIQYVAFDGSGKASLVKTKAEASPIDKKQADAVRQSGKNNMQISMLSQLLGDGQIADPQAGKKSLVNEKIAPYQGFIDKIQDPAIKEKATKYITANADKSVGEIQEGLIKAGILKDKSGVKDNLAKEKEAIPAKKKEEDISKIESIIKDIEAQIKEGGRKASPLSYLAVGGGVHYKPQLTEEKRKELLDRHTLLLEELRKLKNS